VGCNSSEISVDWLWLGNEIHYGRAAIAQPLRKNSLLGVVVYDQLQDDLIPNLSLYCENQTINHWSLPRAIIDLIYYF